jgi:DNA-binding CsgD family transcriptional regulator
VTQQVGSQRHRQAPLVGRRHELDLLWSRYQATAGGSAGVVLVAGDPGIGKTRLLATLAERAAADGATVLQGSASQAEGMPPYLPVLTALGSYVRFAPLEQLRAQADARAAILATILPELAERLGELAPGYALPPEQARLRLYDAVGAFLAALSTERPLLLVLDDLHWADAATLDLMCHVARHQPEARLLVVGAYREDERAQNPALERALVELTRLRLLTAVALGPLSEPEVAALAHRVLAAPADPDLNRLLHEQCEGNPFFAEELLLGWQEMGAMRQDGGRWILGLSPDTRVGLPPSLTMAIGERLARLDPEVVDLLQTATIVGRTFAAALLADAAGMDVEAVEELLLPAVRARLLHTDGSGAFTFSHDKIRECLYAAVTSARRRRLHGFIGRALETRPDQDSAQHLSELAFHFTSSGDRARGATYAERAAAQALRSFAADEAMRHFKTALDMIDGADARRGTLLFGLGEAAILAGHEREAATAFAAAQSWFEQAGEPVAAVRAAHRLGQAWVRLEEHVAAQSAFETALALLASSEEPRAAQVACEPASAPMAGEKDTPEAVLVQVLADLGNMLVVSLHQLDAGVAHVRRALELAQRLGDDRLLAAASRTLGNLLVRSNDLDGGIALLEQALALATVADDPVEAAECCACLAPAYFWRGDLRQSGETTRQRLTWAQRCHDSYQLRHVYTWLAVVAGLQGNLAETERWLDQAEVIVERLASPEPRAYVQFCRGAMAYTRGEYAEAEAGLQEALAIFRQIGPGALVWYQGLLCVVQATHGKTAEARAGLDELDALLAELPLAEPLAGLAQTALLLDDQTRLARYYPQLTALEGRFADFLIDRLLGEIETWQGDWAAAQRHLAAAEAVARKEVLSWELARTLEAQANLILAQGKHPGTAGVQELLEQALELVQRIGNPSEADRLQERLRTLVRGRPVRPRLPAGLSEREAEVLRLVATGKSNREIAQALYLSESTVAHHLTSIFAKTGVDNRAAATAFALRHNLA